ncbi:MAG TPA: putative quinol monooxygenase [Gaiellales bacterium]
MLVVIARYRAEPGKGDRVAAILARHVPPTRAEPGCLRFVANRSVDDGDRFVLYEQYADEAAFQAHRESAHFRENVELGIVPLLAERTWERYAPVEPPVTPSRPPRAP